MTEELGKPLRVLAFSDVALPEGSGGEERQIEEVYGRWVESSRAEVLLVALGGEGLPQHDRRRGIRIVRAPQLRLGRLTGAQAALSTAVWPLAFRATRAFRPHVIHANTLFHATSSAALVAAWRHRTPFVITAHIGSLDALPQPYRFMAKAYEQSVGRVLVRRADRVICVGNEVRDHIRGLGADDARLAVVPNGVDSSRFHPPTKARRRDDTVVIATIGRLIFNKGHHLVIEAVRQLVRDGAQLRLLVVGDGPMRKRLQTCRADEASSRAGPTRRVSRLPAAARQ